MNSGGWGARYSHSRMAPPAAYEFKDYFQDFIDNCKASQGPSYMMDC